MQPDWGKDWGFGQKKKIKKSAFLSFLPLVLENSVFSSLRCSLSISRWSLSQALWQIPPRVYWRTLLWRVDMPRCCRLAGHTRETLPPGEVVHSDATEMYILGPQPLLSFWGWGSWKGKKQLREQPHSKARWGVTNCKMPLDDLKFTVNLFLAGRH